MGDFRVTLALEMLIYLLVNSAFSRFASLFLASYIAPSFLSNNFQFSTLNSQFSTLFITFGGVFHCLMPILRFAISSVMLL